MKSQILVVLAPSENLLKNEEKNEGQLVEAKRLGPTRVLVSFVWTYVCSFGRTLFFFSEFSRRY